MSNTVISPNMTLPVPVVGVDPGTDWANNVNACMSGIDSHDHTTGKGVPITPDGLNINADLPLSQNNLTTTRSVNFYAQGSPLALSSDVGCIYESGVDLYYNDGAGNQVRITQGGAVAGATGTITGLPSGTASASFAGGTFTFQSATLTPATMAVGPLVIGRSTASSKTVTLAPNAAQASDFAVTFPAALPASTNYMTLGSTGALSFNSSGSSGTGAVVLATSPTISGPTLSGTIHTSITGDKIVGTTSGGDLTPFGITGTGINVVTAVGPSITNMTVSGSSSISNLTVSGTTTTNLTASRVVVTNSSSQLSTQTITGSGSFVGTTSPTIASPTFTGDPAGTISSATYSPTVTATLGTGASAVGFSYTRIGSRVVVYGQISGTSNASGGFFVTVTVPVLPTNNFAATSDAIGVASSQFGAIDKGVVLATTSAKTVTMFFSYTVAGATSVTANITFSYSCA